MHTEPANPSASPATQPITTALATTWDTYTAAWRADSEATRQDLLAHSVHPDCHYADPLVQAAGWPALTAYMRDLQQQIPGVHFVTQQFIAHHQKSMARWQMVDGQAQVLGEGVSFGEYTTEGMLLRMTGFFEVPAAA